MGNELETATPEEITERAEIAAEIAAELEEEGLATTEAPPFEWYMLKSKMSEKAFNARKKFDNFNHDDP
jgi:hypothetical protein